MIESTQRRLSARMGYLEMLVTVRRLNVQIAMFLSDDSGVSVSILLQLQEAFAFLPDWECQVVLAECGVDRVRNAIGCTAKS